jgi:hypothetical protein
MTAARSPARFEVESSDTQEFKDFLGGQLYIEHAGSPARLKSTTVKKTLVDEFS